LKVRGILIISGSPLVKFSDEELRNMVKPGFIKEQIIR
jgi:hypothetical protein